jgi:hypothetical protein
MQMKEVTKKDLPVVSGGEYHPDGCIPDPFKLGPWPEVGFPPEPMVPGPDDSTTDA